MDLPAEFQSSIDAIESNAAAETVYGTPVERADRTVVPIARIRYGFGGGSGRDEDGEGGGLGGGLSAQPAGALEITDTGTKFVNSADRRRSIAFLAAGIVAGLIVSWLLQFCGTSR